MSDSTPPTPRTSRNWAEESRDGQAVDDPWQAITAVRQRLHQRGYQVLPNRGRPCLYPGWSTPKYVAHELTDGCRNQSALERIASWSRRFAQWHTTGVRLADGLGVIDFDVDDGAVMGAMYLALENIAPQVLTAPTRLGSGTFRKAVFVRIEGEDFIRLDCRKYRNGDKEHCIEIFGGKLLRNGNVSRQFGIYGPHSYKDNGEVAVHYRWTPGLPALHEVPLAELPTLTKAQGLEIITRFETLAEDAGWERVEQPDTSSNSTAVYDIDENTRFDTDKGGVQLTYEELCTEQSIYGDLRCSSSFMANRTGTSTSRCWVFWHDARECVAVFVYGDEQIHFPAELALVEDWSTTPLAEFMRKLRAERGDDWGIFSKPRPVVKYGPLSEMADCAERILLDARVPFYQRGIRLVRPVVLPVQSFHGETASAPQLAEVELPYLRDTLCRNSRWVKFDARSNKWKNAFPSPDAGLVLLKRFGDWKFPVLAGIISTPTLRPDGTILKDAGYDPATQLLLIDPPAMSAIPEHPTRDDALTALRLLKDVLAEFPFARDDGVSRAVALSAQVSTVCRGAYPIVPVHIIDAPAAGSGKSYLLSTVSWIATGQAMPVLGAGRDEAELGKRLDAAVLTGQPLICIDNVVGELGGADICRLTEQWRPQVRILGLTKLVDVDARGISFFANGNNIVVFGDFCRRVLRSRLDAENERPEQRRFKHNPMQTILAERGRYVAACLTICRAYIAAGRPQRLPPLASYGEWSDTVRSALVWLGEADPVASQDMTHAQDPETAALLALLQEWRAVFGTGKANGQPLREVLRRCDWNDPNPVTGAKVYTHSALRSAVLAVMPIRHSLTPDATALGQWLRGRKDRRIGGLWFNKQDQTGTTPALWWVEAR